MASVKAVEFSRPGKHGDFKFMSKQERYKSALFLISENMFDYFTKSEPGGGTAVLRLLCYGHCEEGTKPLAAGIPTGWTMGSGFTCMDLQVQTAIDRSFERIYALLETYSYDKVLYSCDPKDPYLIGRGIFADTLCDEVVHYISDKIHDIPAEVEKRKANDTPLATRLNKIRKFEEAWLRPYALLHNQNMRMKMFITQRHGQKRKVSG
tara:strand:+ start:136 stop:759 length:624 start_codon:yes stop_codon:yes gene_type:complete